MNTILKMVEYQKQKIILCQSIIRRWLHTNKNIYNRFKSEKTKKKFMQEINGYHLINETPIKESVWEEINRNIVNNNCKVSDNANGNHQSGKDTKFDNWNISNKTGKIINNKINISSYRLTTVCSDKNPGNQQEIINEINKRDKTFDYYSILLREELPKRVIYYWCIIPKYYYIFNINKYIIEHKIGKKGKKKELIVGWKSIYFDITFSQSSQLWFHFSMKDIKQFIIDKTVIDMAKPTLSYTDIYNLYISN